MRVLPLAEVKNILSNLSKERELTREQRISMEHSEHVTQLNEKKAADIIPRLLKIGKIEERQAVKIADLLPKERDAVVAIFAKETSIPSDNDIEKILELVKEYL